MNEARPALHNVRALILAAGYGTRLAPVTDHLPKPLLPVAGQPLLDQIIARVLAAGVPEVGVNSHHLGTLLATHLADHAQAEQLRHFPEQEILGTGGALDNARDFLAKGSAFLVHNGDVLCDVDLNELLQAHEESAAVATMLLVDWPAINSVTLGADGALRHIGGTGGKQADQPGDRQLTYAGVGVFDRSLLADIGPGFSSLIDPLVRAMKQDATAVRGYAPEGISWNDLGTLGSWLAAADCDANTAAGFNLERITGHGSDRRFWRLGLGEWSAVAMVSPPEDEEFDRFLTVGRFLADHDLGVAETLAVDEPGRTVLMSDLGRETLWAMATARSTKESALCKNYQRVVDHLLALQALTPLAAQNCPLAVDRTLDLDQLRWETSYFQDRFLKGHLGLSETKLAPLEAEFEALADIVVQIPQVLIHRDFQSQNILLQDQKVRLVDYQGLRLGPLTYDLASLLWDPYVELPQQLRQDLVAHFAAGCGLGNDGAVRAMTIVAGLQRLMQALGAFGFLGHVKGKAEYLKHIPAAVQNLNLLLSELAVCQTRAEVVVADQLPPALPYLTRLMNGLVSPGNGS